MTNARNTQALEDAGRAVWPGMVIYDVGDEAHATGTSDHNHDDKTLPQGGRAEQSDSDSYPEVRALDFMLRGPFDHEQAMRLVDVLVRLCRNRISYVIYNGYIWRRRNGFIRERYTGSNPHRDHVHVSTLAADDENASPWTPVLALKEDEMTEEQFQAILGAIRAAGKSADAASLRANGILTGTDVETTWSSQTPNAIQNNVLADRLAEISQRLSNVTVTLPPVTVDAGAIEAGITAALANPTVIQALAKAVADEEHNRMES